MQNKISLQNNIKVPPHSIENERALIGSILLNPAIIPKVREIIGPEDMYREAHEIILNAIYTLFENKNPINFISLDEELAKLNKIEESGGGDYLAKLSDMVSTSQAWQYHADIIKDRAIRRDRILKNSEIIDRYFHPGYPVDDLLSEERNSLTLSSDNTEVISNDKLYSDKYDEIYNKKDPGIYPCIECLDDQMYFEKGYIHAIAAESGVGKSALLIQIGDLISQKYNEKVLYYSLESTSKKLASRMIARHSKVALTRINKCHFSSPDQEERLFNTVKHLYESNLIFIDHSKYQEIEKLIIHTESYCLNNKVIAVFVDFLQLLSSITKQNSRHLEISYIIKQFKLLAKNLDIPIIFASQLRKDIKGRPTLDDLKESGDIRTHTDNIFFLYAPDSEPTVYPVEFFMAKGKEQDRFSQWLEFNGNYQEFKEGEKPLSLKYKKYKNGFDD